MVAGCAGGSLENIVAMAGILRGAVLPGGGPRLGINPASRLVARELIRLGVAGQLMEQGVELRPCICGPCFGVTDVPANGTLSARHVTRNYFTREGSKPGAGQLAACVLMDARSIAATALRGGVITPATQVDPGDWGAYDPDDDTPLAGYGGTVFHGYRAPQPDTPAPMGPNIADWPPMAPLPRHLLLRVAGAYEGDLTTDELSPSGEAASFRSNPRRAADYTLSQRDPGYVARAKEIGREAQVLEQGGDLSQETREAVELAGALCQIQPGELALGSAIAARQIGEGSSREQAASCQRVLGGWANLAESYATKRYRSNLINWGLLPVLLEQVSPALEGRFLLLPEIRQAVSRGDTAVKGVWLPQGTCVRLELGPLTPGERETLLEGSVINYYRRELHPRP